MNAAQVEAAQAIYEVRKVMGIGPDEFVVGDLPEEVIVEAFLRAYGDACERMRIYPCWLTKVYGCCYCGFRTWGPSSYRWRKAVNNHLLPAQASYEEARRYWS